MTNRAHVLLWTDQSAAYLNAIKAAGLSDRVAVDTLSRKEKPSADQLARTEALMAGAVPAGLLPKMPKLRWAQAMSAGVEGWLALPDLPSGLTLTCARGTHTESMPENIVGALFHVAKPYSTAVENQKSVKWVHTVAQPLTGKTLGILGLGAIGQEVARIVTALGMRVIGTRRRPAPMANVAEVLPPDRTDEVLSRSDFVLLLLPATPDTDTATDAVLLLSAPAAISATVGSDTAPCTSSVAACTPSISRFAALLYVIKPRSNHSELPGTMVTASATQPAVHDSAVTSIQPLAFRIRPASTASLCSSESKPRSDRRRQ